MKLILEDNFNEVQAIVEDNQGSKKYVIKGLFSTPDEKNRNGRVYPKKLWENALVEWQNKADKNPKYRLCELEHPPYADPDPWKAVAKIREIKFKEDGKIYGEAEILDNPADTRIGQLKALIDAGMPIGISSRGLGRIGKNSVVEEYKLQTFDIVSSPSNYGSELEGFRESLETSDYTADQILKDKNFSINEDGDIICDEQGCEFKKHKTETETAETSEPEKVEEGKFSKPRDAFTKKELENGIKELKGLMKQYKSEKEIIQILGIQLQRLEAFYQMGKETGFKIGEGTGSGDITQNKISLLDALTEYVDGPTEISASEQILLNIMTDVIETDQIIESDAKALIKNFWNGANELKSWVKKADKQGKIYKQLENSLGGVSDVIETVYDLKGVTEGFQGRAVTKAYDNLKLDETFNKFFDLALEEDKEKGIIQYLKDLGVAVDNAKSFIKQAN